MKSSDFIIEHQCPQCGAPAELEETDRIFTCDYCRVTSCLLQHRYFRYILPHKAPDGTDIVYFPYWHFRGFHLACTKDKIVKRFVDSTCQAMKSDIFPFSLGLRSQTLKLKFATDETDGNFIKPNIPKPQVMDIFKARFLHFFDDPPAHQAFIGESLSLIYAPFYVKDVLYDAVLNKPATNSLPDDVKPENLKVACYPPRRSNWRIGFTPAICPECGWDLTGKRNAIVFFMQ
ncbi:hypothetical protein QUF76_14345 [Desulfobacterales bacterium HSG16]|nr:hypothetical protein [Desulfobacterales bacterium HSG16]